MINEIIIKNNQLIELVKIYEKRIYIFIGKLKEIKEIKSIGDEYFENNMVQEIAETFTISEIVELSSEIEIKFNSIKMTCQCIADSKILDELDCANKFYDDVKSIYYEIQKFNFSYSINKLAEQVINIKKKKYPTLLEDEKNLTNITINFIRKGCAENARFYSMCDMIKSEIGKLYNEKYYLGKE